MQSRSFPQHLLYGGDYNPEQWLDSPEILRQDVALMQQARINTVTLGVFSWAELEPNEGEYHFGWLRAIIDDLFENGIRTILATPSGARPRWLAEAYPEVLRTGEDRQRMLYGERHNHCYTSPVYREKVGLLNRRLAQEFGNHPAVILWHISNEYGGECHCDLCQNAFRDWLRRRYTDISALNKAWWTAFWSHTYTSFDQIESPSSRGDTGLLGLNLDWKRFVTAQTRDFLRAEAAALRSAGARQPTTTNFMEDYTGLNYYELAQEVDYVSWDSYPRWHCGDDIATALDTALQHDMMRGLKEKPWLLMESSPSAVNWHEISRLKKPGVLIGSALQAVAHGADSAQFFQIRQGRGGFEKFHGAVIDHYGGSDTRVFREAASAGKLLEELSAKTQIVTSHVEAPAALLYDMESRWALEGSQGPRNEGLFYRETLRKVYSALRRCRLNVDVRSAQSIRDAQGLSRYQLLAAPMLYMFREGFAEILRTYVQHGGTLVTGYLSGVADETDLCWLGGTPHGLLDVLGLRTEEIDALPDGRKNLLLPCKAAVWPKADYTCEHLCELVRLGDAVPLLTYGRDFYQGSAAVTFHSYGSGQAYYVGADAEQAMYDDLFELIAAKLAIPRLLEEMPDGLLVSSRRSESAEYVFVQNFSPEPKILQIPEDARLLYGEATLRPYSSVILERPN